MRQKQEEEEARLLALEEEEQRKNEICFRTRSRTVRFRDKGEDEAQLFDLFLLRNVESRNGRARRRGGRRTRP